METPVIVQSLKSSILSSTSLQMDETFLGVVSAAVEQSSCRANTIARGDWKFGPWIWPRIPPNKKKEQIQLRSIRFAFFYARFGGRVPENTSAIAKKSARNLAISITNLKRNIHWHTRSDICCGALIFGLHPGTQWKPWSVSSLYNFIADCINRICIRIFEWHTLSPDWFCSAYRLDFLSNMLSVCLFVSRSWFHGFIAHCAYIRLRFTESLPVIYCHK